MATSPASLDWKPKTLNIYGSLLGDKVCSRNGIEVKSPASCLTRFTGFYRGGPVFMSALAGIDIALWDLKARRLGVPIHQLLGGKVRQKVQVYAWIGGDRPSDVAEAGKERLAQGFRAVK